MNQAERKLELSRLEIPVVLFLVNYWNETRSLKPNSHCELNLVRLADGDDFLPINNELIGRGSLHNYSADTLQTKTLDTCVLVNRIRKTRSDLCTQFVLWLSLTLEIKCFLLYVSASGTVPGDTEKRIYSSENDSHPRFSNKVFLSSSEPYYVYRFLW